MHLSKKISELEMTTIKTEENNFKQCLGLRLMVQRQRLKISQKELGVLIGVTGQQIQKYEHGISRISPHRLALCAEILGKPVGYFYSEGEEPSLKKINTLRIAAEIDQLPVGGLDVVLNIMRNLTRVSEICDAVPPR